MTVPRPDFDAIVVGAGAGGAACACYLTGAGLRVLVLERAHLPRYKACGGAIPRPTLDRLPFDLTGLIRAAPTEVRFTHPGLPAVDFSLSGTPVVMVMRAEFDAFLLERSGAEVWQATEVTAVRETGHEVQVQAGGRRVSARYLVGADGAASGVARGLGLRSSRQLGGTLGAEVHFDGRMNLQSEYGSRAVFSLGVLPWGYGWVFPKGDRLSVGIGRFRPGRADLRVALHREMDRLGIRLNGTHLHGHPIPCYQAPPWPFWRNQPQERLSTHRCLLVGDAAGLVDPLVGEGIRYAIASARIAAQAIARDDLSGYEASIWKEIGHSLATAGLTARLFYRWPGRCFQLGVRNPATVRHFVDLLTEETSYCGIGRRLIAATARWLVGRRAHADPQARAT